MTERLLTKTHNEEEKRIIFKPRNGAEMQEAIGPGVPLYTYSELCRMAKKRSAREVLSHMFRRSAKNIILLQDPSNMNSGHWLSVSCNFPRRQIYFFSTYGGKPDVEKIQWLTDDDLKESGQDLNFFNDGMRELQKHGWEIHYNDYPYQKPGDNTAVCGIYTVAFLRSGLNPDQFEEQTKKIIREGKNPAVYYFHKYFH